MGRAWRVRVRSMHRWSGRRRRSVRSRPQWIHDWLGWVQVWLHRPRCTSPPHGETGCGHCSTGACALQWLCAAPIPQSVRLAPVACAPCTISCSRTLWTFALAARVTLRYTLPLGGPARCRGLRTACCAPSAIDFAPQHGVLSFKQVESFVLTNFPYAFPT